MLVPHNQLQCESDCRLRAALEQHTAICGHCGIRHSWRCAHWDDKDGCPPASVCHPSCESSRDALAATGPCEHERLYGESTIERARLEGETERLVSLWQQAEARLRQAEDERDDWELTAGMHAQAQVDAEHRADRTVARYDRLAKLAREAAVVMRAGVTFDRPELALKAERIASAIERELEGGKR